MSNPNSTPIAFLKNHLGGKEGGLEKHTWRLMHAFKTRGCDVSLLTSSHIAHEDFKTIPIPITRLSSAQKILSFDKGCQKHLKKHPYQLVFGLDRNSFQTHLRAGNGIHAAFLDLRKKSESFLKNVSFSLNPLHKCLLQIEKSAIEHPELKVLLTNSHMVKEQAIHYYNIDPKKIFVVHNGVEWEEKKSDFDNWQEKRNHYLDQWMLPQSAYHFIFVGHDFKRKGLKLLLKALSLLKNPDFFLSIIGKDKNEIAFKDYARSLGLSSKLRFIGSCEDVTPFYQLADCLVIPSLYDPFANVTAEALSMGNYILTSSTNGAHEILDPKCGHILEDLFDEEVFVAALEKAMQNPKTKESALYARNSVKQLDFTHQLPKILDICLR